MSMVMWPAYDVQAYAGASIGKEEVVRGGEGGRASDRSEMPLSCEGVLTSRCGGKNKMVAAIKRAVICGEFEGAVDCCFRFGRLADALLLAATGGRELFQRTQVRRSMRQSVLSRRQCARRGQYPRDTPSLRARLVVAPATL